MKVEDWLWFTGLISVSSGLILLEVTNSIRYLVLAASGLFTMIISLIFRLIGDKRNG